MCQRRHGEYPSDILTPIHQVYSEVCRVHHSWSPSFHSYPESIPIVGYTQLQGLQQTSSAPNRLPRRCFAPISASSVLSTTQRLAAQLLLVAVVPHSPPDHFPNQARKNSFPLQQRPEQGLRMNICPCCDKPMDLQANSAGEGRHGHCLPCIGACRS